MTCGPLPPTCRPERKPACHSERKLACHSERRPESRNLYGGRGAIPSFIGIQAVFRYPRPTMNRPSHDQRRPSLAPGLVTGVAAYLALTAPGTAHAYLDPASGSLFLQRHEHSHAAPLPSSSRTCSRAPANWTWDFSRYSSISST